MATHIDATFIDGVLKPDQPLPLPESARVRLTVEPIEEWSAERAQAALDSLFSRLRERPINSGGVRYTRDELHERR